MEIRLHGGPNVAGYERYMATFGYANAYQLLPQIANSAALGHATGLQQAPLVE